jgi:hypothetical protein
VHWGGSLSHRRLQSPRTAAVFGASAITFAVASVVLSVVDHNATTPWPVLIPTTMFVTVGVVVARRQPANRMGWVLIFAGLLQNLFVLSATYVVFNHWLGRGATGVALAALWFENSFWDLGLIVGLAGVLLFPDGIVAPGWRWTLQAYAVVAGLVVTSQCVLSTIVVSWHDLQVGANGDPIATKPSSGLVGFLGSGLAALAIVPFLITWVVYQQRAFRRSTGVLRQQLKWSTLGALVLVISVAAEIPLGDVTGSVAVHISNLVVIIGIGAFPLGMGLGILKFRLYEIDRLISRTLSYAIVTGLIVACYVLVISVATRVLGFSSPIGVAASTLVAAALFNPLRRRIQRLIDRRFNRAKYDADAMVAAFAARLRDATDLDAVRTDVVSTVYRALEPAVIGFWIRDLS